MVDFLVHNRVRRIAGPSIVLQSTSSNWNWQGGRDVQRFRDALEDRSLFSPATAGGSNVDTVDLDSLDLLELFRYDAFAVTFWRDTETGSANAQVLADYFLLGGSLALYNDASDFDAVGEALGVPTEYVSDNSLSNGIVPFYDGLFGTAFDVAQMGTVGALRLSDVDTKNGTAASVNAAGEITGAAWRPGQYAPGAGTMIIIPDVCMVTTAASYAPLDDNGVFALNGISFVLDAQCAGTVTHYGEGCPGTGDITPTQRLVGCPETGDEIRLEFRNALGGAFGLLWIGFEGRLDLEFKGCPFLVAGSPLLITSPLGGIPGVAGDGDLTFAAILPEDPALDGFQVNTQLWVLDAGAPEGLAVTSGVEFVIDDA